MQSQKQCGCFHPLSGKVHKVQQALKQHVARTGEDLTSNGDGFRAMVDALFPNDRIRKCCMMHFLTMLDSTSTTMFYCAPVRSIPGMRTHVEGEAFYPANSLRAPTLLLPPVDCTSTTTTTTQSHRQGTCVSNTRKTRRGTSSTSSSSTVHNPKRAKISVAATVKPCAS
jgi:hypothetical protein